MDLQLQGKRFVVTGAGSGFGRAVAEGLLNEGAEVLVIARTVETLEAFKLQVKPRRLETLQGDVAEASTIREILDWSEKQRISGILVNAGGPPAGGVFDIDDEQWDEAYRMVLKWKIALTRPLALMMKQWAYGRILFVESVSVKQPVDNLVLSNALRAAVVGYAKTLSREMAPYGTTVNVLAPGYHDTAAMQRLYRKKADQLHISIPEAKKQFEMQIPVGQMAGPDAFASLALWLLSPLSFYVTGQTITHDGGLVNGIFG